MTRDKQFVPWHLEIDARILPMEDKLGSRISVVTRIESVLHHLYHRSDERGTEKKKRLKVFFSTVTMRTLKNSVCHEVILMKIRTG